MSHKASASKTEQNKITVTPKLRKLFLTNPKINNLCNITIDNLEKTPLKDSTKHHSLENNHVILINNIPCKTETPSFILCKFTDSNRNKLEDITSLSLHLLIKASLVSAKEHVISLSKYELYSELLKEEHKSYSIEFPEGRLLNQEKNTNQHKGLKDKIFTIKIQPQDQRHYYLLDASCNSKYITIYSILKTRQGAENVLNRR